MSAPCSDLDTFFDGELSGEKAGAFRDHLATCERCQAALHGRMQEEVIAGMAHERVEQPRASAVTPAQFDTRRRRIVILTLAPLLAAAAAFVIWFVGIREHEHANPIEISLTIKHGGSARRGSTAHVGDVLQPMVRGERHRAIWVYRGEHDLVVACPGDARCTSTDSELILELRVLAPGQYSIIVLTSAKPIMAPHGPLDVMLSAVAADTYIKTEHVEVN